MKKIRLNRRFRGVIAVLLSAFILSGCATVYNPATQRREVILIDDKQEVQFGRSMSEQIKKEYPPLQDSQKQLQVNKIGNRIVQVNDRREIMYHFSILDNKDFNAFALPGGYVYIFSGLYDRLTEDEVAAVLAHEVGHVAAKHSIKHLQSALGYNFLMTMALIGLSAKNPQMAQDLSGMANTVYGLLSKGYSREDELFADRLAVRYLLRAGYDPEALVRSLEILDKESGPGGRVFEVLSTHPRMDERIKKVREDIEIEKAALAAGQGAAGGPADKSIVNGQ